MVRQAEGCAAGSTVKSGTSAPVQVTWMKSAPVLVNEFESHTYGGRPEKTPTPPRTMVRAWPVTSQLNPSRGDQRMFAFGKSPVLIGSAGSFSSAGLVRGLLMSGMSARRPRVSVKRSDGDHWSWT